MSSWFPTFGSWLAGPGRASTALQQKSLLRLVAVAIEENLPLVPLLEAWLEDERGVQRWRIRRLIKQLQQGRSLADAVEAVPGVLREEHLLALRFDVQSGTRTAAIRELLAEPTGPRCPPRLSRSLAYLFLVLPLCLAVIAFTQFKIVPVLGKLFREYSADTPPVLAWSLSSWYTLFGVWWLPALAVIALLGWLLATRSGRPLRHALFGRLLRPWRAWRSADVLQKLALAIGAGRPLPGALSTLARYHYDPSIRSDLLYVRNEVEQGADVWSSLAGVRLLTAAEAQLVAASGPVGNQPWILRQLAEVRRRRTTRRSQRASELVMPAIVFLLAALVVFQALTVFQPLMRLILIVT
jgi:protein transport protein HofC